MKKNITQLIELTPKELGKIVENATTSAFKKFRLSTPQIPKELLTRHEVCDLLGVSSASLWKYTKEGKLKSYNIGSKVLYKRSEIIDQITNY